MHPFSRLAAFFLLSLPFSPAIAQLYNPVIDVQHYDFSLALNDDNNSIRGTAVITVLFRETAPQFTLDLTEKNSTGKGMTVLSVSENNQPISFSQDSNHLLLQTGSTAGARHSYTIRYEGIPADGLVISNNKYGHRGFFGDNWPNRAHNWLPCVDDPSDKATLDWRITAPDHYQVVANGALQEERTLPNHQKLTHWKESTPLSPKIMVSRRHRLRHRPPGAIPSTSLSGIMFSRKIKRSASATTRLLHYKYFPFISAISGPTPLKNAATFNPKRDSAAWRTPAPSSISKTPSALRA